MVGQQQLKGMYARSFKKGIMKFVENFNRRLKMKVIAWQAVVDLALIDMWELYRVLINSTILLTGTKPRI